MTTHKDVFSFKLNEYRPFVLSDKIAFNYSQPTQPTKERSNSQILPATFKSPPTLRSIYNSPPSRISKIHYPSSQDTKKPNDSDAHFEA